MASSRSRSVRTARALLLVVFFGSLLTIAGLLWFGNSGRPDDEAPDEPTTDETGAPRLDSGEMAIAGDNFRQEVTQGERVLFRIEGGRYQADRSNNVFLEDVRISVAREDGEWQLRGDSGRFNRESKEARLEGEVAVAGPNQLEVAARWLELRRGGTVVVASRGTRFALGDSLAGESEHLRMDLDRQVTVLSDGVVVRGIGASDRPPFDLAAQRVLFEREPHRLDAEGEVRLRSEEGALDARRITVQLDQEDRRVVGLRALWNVEGWLRRTSPNARLAPPESTAATVVAAIERLAFAGTTLALDLDGEERPVRLQLDGSSTAQATLETVEAGGLTHRVRAIEVIGSFTEGRLSSLLARRPVELEERRGNELLRVGRARRVLAAFDQAGQMVRVDLEENVVLAATDLTANADRASMLLLEDSVTLWGSPASPVKMQRAGDLLNASEVVHRAKTNSLEAKGAVRATMMARDGALLGSAALGDAEGPVMVEASEASFREAENETVFRGSVRAWRGASLLLADQLRGDPKGETLAASGSVRTVWRPALENDAGAATTGGAAATAETTTTEEGVDTAERERRVMPVEIAARQLTYSSVDRLLRYEGDVSVVQGAQTVTCQDLAIELDEQDEPRRYVCSGRARVVDADLERTVEGSQVVYHPGGGEVEVSGEPVKLVDPKLGRIEGPRLWYSVDDETVRMGPVPPGGTPAAAVAADTGE
jgi:lipopolysaccharide export system protein LptA